MTNGFTDAYAAALRRFHSAGLAAADMAEIFRCKEELVVKRLLSLGLRPALTPSDSPTLETAAIVGGHEVIKACNCACCRKELRSVWRGTVCVRSCVAGYVESRPGGFARPYCGDCLPMALERFKRR